MQNGCLIMDTEVKWEQKSEVSPRTITQKKQWIR